MAYYLMNKVVKLARTALGMTQEELCEGICDIRVLSRSENEKQEMKKVHHSFRPCQVLHG